MTCFVQIFFSEYYIPKFVKWDSLSARSCDCWINALTKIDERLSVYFSAVALLHVELKISINGFSDKLVDILWRILGNKFNLCCLRKAEVNTSELVEFLQKSAVEHLTTYRQSVARDIGSVATIVTTDFEALYAYKRGDY